MKISELFNKKKVFSCEVFPPKQQAQVETIYNTLSGLKETEPDFISVTYGAGGTKNGAKTLDIVSSIIDEYNIAGVAHLPCVYLSKEDALETVQQLKERKIENILALRGDKIEGVKPKTDFIYASDLVAFLKEQGEFNIIGACYPEGHKETPTIDQDINNLKIKVESGVSHLVSQLFFDNDLFLKYIDKLKNAGVYVPVEAGIMPVLNKAQIVRMTSLCGTSVPKKLQNILNKYENDEVSLKQAGIAYAIDQIDELYTSGVDGVHLYTMNKADVAKEIKAAVGCMI